MDPTFLQLDISFGPLGGHYMKDLWGQYKVLFNQVDFLSI